MAKNKKDKVADVTTTQLIEPNVFIKVVKGKRVIKSYKLHNEATKFMLYGMLMSLMNKQNSNLLPTYIGVGTNSDTSDVFEMDKLGAETTLERSLIETMYKGSPNIDTSLKKVTVRCQGIIQAYQNSSDVVNEIGLFGTEDGDSLLARVVVPDGITLSAGESLVVDWTFAIQNVN